MDYNKIMSELRLKAHLAGIDTRPNRSTTKQVESPDNMYVISDGANVKIGLSDSPSHRLKELQTGNPNTLHLVCSFAGNKKYESRLHRRFKKYRVRGEWYSLSDEIVKFIGQKGGTI